MPIVPAPPIGAPNSDDDLMQLVADGNHEAFAALYDRISGRVLGLVQRVLIDPAQSEEVAQDVFLEVWQQASRFDRARGKAAAWILTVAHRRAIDRVRSSQTSRDRDYAVGIRDYEPSIDDVAESTEVRMEHQRVVDAMSRLTAAQRNTLELTYFQGLTTSEAARVAGVPLGTMKSRLHYSLIALRTQLKPAA